MMNAVYSSVPASGLSEAFALLCCAGKSRYAQFAGQGRIKHHCYGVGRSLGFKISISERKGVVTTMSPVFKKFTFQYLTISPILI